MANEMTGPSNSSQIIKPVGDSQRKTDKGRIRLMACEPLRVLTNEDSQTLYPPVRVSGTTWKELNVFPFLNLTGGKDKC